MPPADFAPPDLYQPACRIIERLRNAGHQAYIAGGAVRDHLLGREQTDLDIATSAHPDEVKALFRRTVAVGESFGVILVHEENHPFEVATFREDSDYRDGRHPGSVRYSTAEADVRRRDFTINGMLWDPGTKTILDWVGGRQDVQARLIRTIGPPGERFHEDRLRMVRAVRFAAQLGFAIEETTWQAIRDQAEALAPVSTERMRDELGKLLAAPGWLNGLELLADSGLEPVIRQRLLAEWKLLHKSRQEHPPLEGTLGAGSMGGPAMPGIEGWLLLLAPALLGMPHHATMENSVGSALEKLDPAARQSFPNWLRGMAMALKLSSREARELEEAAQVLVALHGIREMPLAGQMRMLRHPGMPVARSLLPRFWPEGLDGLETWLCGQDVRHAGRLFPAPLIDGVRLLGMGVPRGPQVGAFLHDLETLQLEDRLHSVQEAEALVARWLARTR